MKRLLPGVWMFFSLPLLAAAQPLSSPITPPDEIGVSGTSWSVNDRGPNHRLWIRQTYTTTASGKVITNTQSCVELGSGLEYLDPTDNQWHESDPSFQVTAGGSAVVGHCQHQLVISPNINDTNGAVDLQTSDGQRLRSSIIGLVLFDPATGQSLQIAAIRDTPGQQTAPNEIVFLDAFDGLKASVRLRNERAEFHQDVLLDEKLTSDQITALGFNPATVRLEVWTEFMEAPEPVVPASASLAGPSTVGAASTSVADTSQSDQQIDFGNAVMTQGAAFVPSDASSSVPIQKQWLPDNNSNYLIEGAGYSDLAPLLAPLPVAGSAKFEFHKNSRLLATGRSSPVRMASVAHKNFHIEKLASIKERTKNPEVVMDYNLQISGGTLTNYVFAGDTNYYFSANTSLSGTTIFEGNTVLKYASNVSLTVSSGSTIDWRGSAYHPVTFTSKEDNSVGAAIGTGTPTNFYANPALNVSAISSSTLINARFFHAKNGVYANGYTLKLYHSQFVHCSVGCKPGSILDLNNVLFSDVSTCFYGYNSTLTIYAENVTFSGASALISDLNGTVNAGFNNCIVANVTSIGFQSIYVYSTYCCFYNSPTIPGNPVITANGYPFQTVGGGSFYLSDGSNLRNAGTTIMDSMLLVGLRQRTTYPPIVYSGLAITNDITLGPQAQRDTDAIDLGYHYDPLDYILSQVTAQRAALTVLPGTAIGCYSITALPALHLLANSSLNASGKADQLIEFVQGNAVQESLGSFVLPISFLQFSDSGNPVINVRFTDWSGVSFPKFIDGYQPNSTVVSIAHSQLHDGTVWVTGPTISSTNCLFDRCWVELDYENHSFRNNLFFRGWLDSSFSDSSWQFYDNQFDRTLISGGDSVTANYNAFETNQPSLPGTKVILQSQMTYTNGPLGGFYQAITNLVDKGSTWATNVGLYHFTTQTSQVKEAGTKVDIGLHYGATTNGIPIDTDGDGVADYLEDSNGDGAHNAGDLSDWKTYNSVNQLDSSGLLIYTPLK